MKKEKLDNSLVWAPPLDFGEPKEYVDSVIDTLGA